ncbi:MAG: xanthine dehydrogenase accessory protein XdhC [Robiginitomaculum sp.]|nr:xanthine dehydrogenase accessory protein XdhC [Robiginitomaculum sp.]
MFNWQSRTDKLLANGEVFCLITITEAEGSTPRDVGTIMLVTREKEYGTIGGGNLELQTIDAARSYLTNNRHGIQTLDYILGPDAEQCCGGRVTLSLQRIADKQDLPLTYSPQTYPLVLFGAGHVGTALASALAPLPFDLHWYDNRSEKMSGIVQAFSDPQQAILAAPKNALFLIMTHDHSLDYQLVSAVLKRNDFAYLGLIGSKTKRARFVSRLKKDGFSQMQISRLTCPIGIEGIQGKEPEIIAASVAAQLLQTIGY